MTVKFAFSRKKNTLQWLPMTQMPHHRWKKAYREHILAVREANSTKATQPYLNEKLLAIMVSVYYYYYLSKDKIYFLIKMHLINTLNQVLESLTLSAGIKIKISSGKVMGWVHTQLRRYNCTQLQCMTASYPKKFCCQWWQSVLARHPNYTAQEAVSVLISSTYRSYLLSKIGHTGF